MARYIVHDFNCFQSIPDDYDPGCSNVIELSEHEEFEYNVAGERLAEAEDDLNRIHSYMYSKLPKELRPVDKPPVDRPVKCPNSLTGPITTRMLREFLLSVPDAGPYEDDDEDGGGGVWVSMHDGLSTQANHLSTLNWRQRDDGSFGCDIILEVE